MKLVYDAGRNLIAEWVDVQIMAENAATERLCEQAIALTPSSRWAHLVLVTRNDNWFDRVPPAVACSWPDPVTDSPMALRARLSVGEA